MHCIRMGIGDQTYAILEFVMTEGHWCKNEFLLAYRIWSVKYFTVQIAVIFSIFDNLYHSAAVLFCLQTNLPLINGGKY